MAESAFAELLDPPSDQTAIVVALPARGATIGTTTKPRPHNSKES